ncbi:DUF221 family protein [Rhizoctonia solani AG-1 IA]|uniref:DUF221 family protein n=1 Tax=Thanatephorus cucumeris (strain AG1-IA) TaxID=983506 RepID=L8WJV8_THACA|nr:DUF221 family protein [Rhizoctonia solani AG-1 IA]
MSIDPAKATSANNTSRTFGTAFVTNLALLAIQVGGFVVLKKKFDRIYSPRTLRKRSAELPSGPWKWLPAVIFAPAEDIIRKNGLDAYLFVRFLKLMIWVFGAFTLISWPILLPINSVNMPGGGKDGLLRLSWSNITEGEHRRRRLVCPSFRILLDQARVAHICARTTPILNLKIALSPRASKDCTRYIYDELCEDKALRQFCAFVPGGINRIWIYRDQPDLPKLYNDRLEVCQRLEKAIVKYMRAVTKAWGKHLKAEKAKAKAQGKSGKDIEATQDNQGIPDSYPLTRLSTVRASLLNQPLPPTPRHSGVTPTNKTGDLVLNAANRQQGSRSQLLQPAEPETRIAMDMVPRPTHHLGLYIDPNRGGWRLTQFQTEIARLNDEINEKRKGLPECKPHGSAFIQCNLQMGAHVLAQCVSYHEPLKMSQKWVEVAPDDIIWDNIDDVRSSSEAMNRYTDEHRELTRFDRVTSCPADTGNSGLSQQHLRVFYPTLINYVPRPSGWNGFAAGDISVPDVVQGIIQGVLPPAVIAILFLLLPIYLRGESNNGFIMNGPLKQRSHGRFRVHPPGVDFNAIWLLIRYFQILEQPSKAVELLATNLPNASIFFLTYIVANGLAGSASALAQVGPLVIHVVKKYLFGSTPRQSFEITFMMPQVSYYLVLLPAYMVLTHKSGRFRSPTPKDVTFVHNCFRLFSEPHACVLQKTHADCYLVFLWVYDQPEPQETGGLYVSEGINVLFVLTLVPSFPKYPVVVGLYIEQLCLAGLFFLDARKTSSLVLGIFMVILLVITIGVQILLRKSFDRPAHAVTSDIEDEEMDLFKRDRALRLQTLIRRKVNKKLKLPTKPKQDKDTGFAPPAPAGEPGTSRIPDAAPRLGTPKLLTRSNTQDSARSRKSNKSKKSDKDRIQIAPAAPAQKSSIAGNSSSEDDSDLDEFAFDHPNTYKDDTLGISTVLLKELHAAKVEASDEGAEMDEKGVVIVKRNPPEEAWSGGLDI